MVGKLPGGTIIDKRPRRMGDKAKSMKEVNRFRLLESTDFLIATPERMEAIIK